MKRRGFTNVAFALALGGLCTLSLVGCKDDLGPSRAPTAQDMRSDPTRMTPEQQKLMADGMRRDAERMHGAKTKNAGATQ